MADPVVYVQTALLVVNLCKIAANVTPVYTVSHPTIQVFERHLLFHTLANVLIIVDNVQLNASSVLDLLFHPENIVTEYSSTVISVIKYRLNQYLGV